MSEHALNGSEVRYIVATLYAVMNKNGLSSTLAAPLAIGIVLEDLWGQYVVETLDCQIGSRLESLQEIIDSTKHHTIQLQKRSRIMFWLNVLMVGLVSAWLIMALL